MKSLRFVVPLLLVACSPSPEKGPTGDETLLTADSYPAAYETATCNLFVRCGLFSDIELCRSMSAGNKNNFNSLGVAAAATKTGKATFNADAAGKCLAAMATQTCTASFTVESAVSDCAQVFTGTVANGGACAADDMCVHGSFCREPEDTASCDGVCAAGGTECHTDLHCTGGKVCDNGMCVTQRAPGALHAACGSDDACQAGLYCKSASDSQTPATCETAAAPGQPCDGGCLDGTFCMDKIDGSGHFCLAIQKKGAACESTTQCGGLFTSLICDPTSLKCVDAPPAGSACIAGYCDPQTAYCDTSASTPTCREYKADGAACDPSNWSECGAFFGPVTGTCQYSGDESSGICVRSTPQVCTQ